jgi:signal transduction histidine kinase
MSQSGMPTHQLVYDGIESACELQRDGTKALTSPYDLPQQLLKAKQEERQYLARELHDTVIQELIGLGFKLADLEQDKTPSFQQELKSLRDNLNEVIRQLRTTISQLRNTTNPPSLAAALEDAIKKARHSAPMLRFHSELDPCIDTLPRAIRSCLFNVVQESLNNIVRHADADQVWIRVSLQRKQILFTIQDDGCGFSVPASLSSLQHQHHFGLLGIAEQIEALAGTLMIHSFPDSGTILSATLPLPESLDISEAKNG